MPLDPHANRLLRILNAGRGGRSAELTIEARRSGLAELIEMAGAPPPAMSAVENGEIPGQAGPLPIRIYTPPGLKDRWLPGLVYFHGGGLVSGNLSTHDGVARALAAAAACRVISVDYRLAPEHPFPAATDDASSAISHIASHGRQYGLDTARLGICGDSAGGTLAAAACRSMPVDGTPLAALVLICPLLDHSRPSESRLTYAKGYFMDQATFDQDLQHYLPEGVDRADPCVSPARAQDLSGMPATFIHSAEFDPARDEAREYAERLQNAGTQVSYTCHPGMIHLFYAFGGLIPYARSALATIGTEIRGALA